MNERGFFYGGRILLDEFESGTPYDKISHVCVINITNFHVRKSNEVVEPVGIMYTKNPVEPATDAFSMYHIQMPEFRKLHRTLDSVKGNPFEAWLYMLDEGYKDEEEMKVLSQMSVGMKNFADQYGIAINDPTLIQRYRMEMDWQREDASRLNAAERRGEQHGVDKEKRETAKRMKTDGMDYALISKYTGLTTGQITEL